MVTETMTIAELIAELEKHPKHLPVVAGWEGIYVQITSDRFSRKSNRFLLNGKVCVVIDVDDY